MKRFPGLGWRSRLRRSWAADTDDRTGLAADTAVDMAMEQEAHLARRMWKPGWACWAVVKVAEAWASLALALRIADKLWHLRAWKPHT